MATTGDILEVTLRSSMDTHSSVYLNVFHFAFESSDTPSLNIAAPLMTQMFAADWLPTLLPIISDAFHFDSMNWQNLDDPDDFGEANFDDPITGDVASDVAPPYVSWGFQLTRFTRSTRNGFKRFAGCPETFISNGGVAAGNEALFAAVEVLLGSPTDFNAISPSTLEFTLNPKIVRKTGQFTYSAVNDCQAALFRGLGTQNSRKDGYGM